MPTQVTVDCLLPTGVIVQMHCNRDATLESIKVCFLHTTTCKDRTKYIFLKASWIINFYVSDLKHDCTSSVSIEWNSIWLSGPAHEIMTKTSPRTLPGLLRVQGSKGCGRSRECGAYGVKGPGCGGLWVWGLSRGCVGVMRSRGCGYGPMGVEIGGVWGSRGLGSRRCGMQFYSSACKPMWHSGGAIRIGGAIR